MKPDQLLNLAKSTDALLKKPSTLGPQTDDDLWHWIKDNLNIEVPRTCVCTDHQSPFQFLSDVYFERVTTSIAIANRGGSKTMISAIIHLLNSLFKPGCESAQVGAVEQQARRAYTNLQLLLKAHGKVDLYSDHPMVQRSVERETSFTNGSTLEILIGTPAGVNGPHPQKLGTDEAELMPDDVFQESRNMSQSKGNILAQDWITSTRKGAHGPMQRLLDENLEAERAGADKPYEVYTWCVFESAAKVENCQVANPEAENPCNCDKVVKGSWDDGSPRRFSDVCRGRLAKSDGFLSLHDIHKTFRNTNQETYEAQQLCTKPETAGLVLPWFDRQRHGIKWYDPDPENGLIYMSVDFGGTNPHAVNWYQVLDRDVMVYGYYQERNESPAEKLKAGTRVCFDEIYIAEVGNRKLADMVVERESFWRKVHPNFSISKRFADPQAKAARLDWMAHDPPLITTFFATRDVKENVKTVRDLTREVRIRVDTTRCENWCNEAEFWHYPKRRGAFKIDDPEIPVDDFDHCMSNFRYCMQNIHVMERKGQTGRGAGKTRPQAGTTIHKSAQKSGVSRYLPRQGAPEPLDPHPLSGRKFE